MTTLKPVPKSTVNQELVEALKEALKLAESGDVSFGGFVLCSESGNAVRKAMGNKMQLVIVHLNLCHFITQLRDALLK